MHHKEKILSHIVVFVEMMFGALKGRMSLFTLLRWLGPWTDQARAPMGVRRTEIQTSDQEFSIWVYDTPSPKGALYIVPGLHHEGPKDPRLDRFARVLAKAGIIVGVPFLPTSIGLVMKPELCSEAKKGLAAFQEHINRPCGIFGISAASIAALAIGSDSDFQSNLLGIMLFGGFSSWKKAILFAACEDGVLPKDPLNLPVVFLNLWQNMNIDVADEAVLLKTWREFIYTTWEKEEMKPFNRYSVVAQSLSQKVHFKDRMIFLQGTSVEPGGAEIVRDVIRTGLSGYEWLDPEPHLDNLNSPLFLTHGRDDVVVPYQQSFALQAMSPPDTPTYITGFYDHTGITNLWRLFSLVPRIPQEIIHSIQLLRSMILISRGKKK